MRLLEGMMLVLAMLFLGSYNTIASKILFQTICPTLPSGHHLFNKPWATNLLMFFGEAVLLIPFSARNSSHRSAPVLEASDLHTDLLASSRRVPLYHFAIPALCDIFGTGFGSVALMYTNAAVWQMLRGSLVIFSAIMAVTVLKRRLRAYHWLGVSIVVLGLLIIGLAAILEEPTSGKKSSHAGFGITLVICAQIFASVQVTFEEYLLRGCKVSSQQTVAMEGIWGCSIMIVVLLVLNSFPGEDHGVVESLPDGLHMMRGSIQVQMLCASTMVCIASYNYVGMQLCRKLSAVTRCLVDSMRTGVVWGFQLFMYYCVSHHYGNPWTEYSIWQFIGFVLLVIGTLIYNNIIKLPGRSTSLELPQRVLQATWSPMVNRAAQWGRGPTFGPQSPDASPGSPLQAPFGASPWSPQLSRLEDQPGEIDDLDLLSDDLDLHLQEGAPLAGVSSNISRPGDAGSHS